MFARIKNLKKLTAFAKNYPQLVVFYLALIIGVTPLMYGYSRHFLSLGPIVPEHFVLKATVPKAEAQESGNGSLSFTTKGSYSNSNGGLVVISAGEEPELKVDSYKARGTGSFKLYQVSQTDLLTYLIYNRDNSDSFSISRVYQIDTTQLPEPTVFQAEITDDDDLEDNLIKLPISDTGIWFLEAELNGVKAETMLIRSNLAGIIHEGNNQSIFWVQNSNYQSVTGAQVELLNLQNGFNSLGVFTTNDDGLATAGANHDVDLALVSKDNDLTIIPVNLENLQSRPLEDSYYSSQFAPRKPGNQSFMFTDRFLYKPGDTIFFKAILRNDDDADYSIPQKTVTVSFGDSDEPIWQKTVAIDQLGTVTDAIPIPSDLEPGYYSLEIMEGESYLEYATVQVAKYRKPDTTVSITADKLVYLPGETVTVDISGEYFLGQPISNQEIRYKIYQQKTSIAGDYDSLKFEPWTGYYGGDEEDLIKEGTATLNRQGEATLDLPAINNTGYRQYWIIQLEYLDAGSTATNDNIRVLIQPGDFVMDSDSSKASQIIVNQPSNFPLKLSKNKADAVISGHKVNATLSYSENYSDYVVEQDNLQATTDENGEFEFQFTPQQSGKYYKLALETTDQAGNLIRGEETFYASARAYNEPTAVFEITTDKEEYRPGETAKITIKTNSEIKNNFVSLGRSYSREFRVLPVTNGSAVFETVIPEKYQPNIYVYAGSFFDGNWRSESINIPVNVDDKELKVEIAFAKEIYGPSETAEVEISVTDGLGRPVQTDLAFWLFDKALLELHGVYFRGIFEQFWQERWISIKTNHSFQGIYNSGAEGGGGGGGEVRSAFKDTAYWNAHVTTDSTGKARLSVELPDNLTTWVAAAVAASSQTQVGDGLAQIKVTKDVVVRPILPGFLRFGDRIVLSSLLHNFTPDSEKFTVTAGFTGGAIDQTAKEITVAGSDFEKLTWPTEITNQLTEAEFNVRAEGLNKVFLVDQVFEKVPVYEYGSWISRFQISQGAVQLPIQLSTGSDQARAKATLKLHAYRYPQLQGILGKLLNYSYGVSDAADTLVAASLLTEYGDRLSVPRDQAQINSTVTQAMTWLAERQDDSGAWLTNDVFDPQLNSFVIEALVLAEKADLPVDSAVTTRALAYFNAWQPTLEGDQALRQYVLSLFDDRTLNKEQVLLDEIDYYAPALMAQAILANHRQGYADSDALAGLFEESKMRETATQLVWRTYDEEERSFYALSLPTVFATRAMLAIDADLAKIEKSLDYLYRNQDGNGLQQANQALATIEYFEKTEQFSPRYDYQVFAGDSLITQGQIGQQTPLGGVIKVEIPKLADASQVRVEQTGTGKLYSTLEIAEFFTDRTLAAETHDLKITRQYLSPKTEKSPLKPGDLVIVQFDISGFGEGETAVEIEDYLPAGLVAIDESLDNSDFDEGGENSSCLHQTVTDQGARLKFCRLFADNGTYSYKARVVSDGVFDVPPAVVKLTNQPSIWARTEATQLTIDGEHALDLLGEDDDAAMSYYHDRTKLIVGVLIVLGVMAFVKRDELPMILQRLKNGRKPQDPQPPQEPQEMG